MAVYLWLYIKKIQVSSNKNSDGGGLAGEARVAGGGEESALLLSPCLSVVASRHLGKKMENYRHNYPTYAPGKCHAHQWQHPNQHISRYPDRAEEQEILSRWTEYSRTSMTRTLMTRLPWLLRTRCSVPRKKKSTAVNLG